MPSLSELRAELKELRKASLGEKPVSRMKKSDIAEQIQNMRRMREETPFPAATPSTPAPKTKVRAAVESIKEAKVSEFPVAPAKTPAPTKKKAPAVMPSAPKKPSKMDMLMKMLEEMEDSE